MYGLILSLGLAGAPEVPDALLRGGGCAGTARATGCQGATSAGCSGSVRRERVIVHYRQHVRGGCSGLSAGCAGSVRTGCVGYVPQMVVPAAAPCPTCPPALAPSPMPPMPPAAPGVPPVPMKTTKVTTTTVTTFTTADAVVAAHNDVRVRAGLRPLAVSMDLARNAAAHAAGMLRFGMRHSGQPVGENIAAGQTSVEQVMTSWQSSPGHRANITGAYTEIGVGQVGTNWCVMFR